MAASIWSSAMPSDLASRRSLMRQAAESPRSCATIGAALLAKFGQQGGIEGSGVVGSGGIRSFEFGVRETGPALGFVGETWPRSLSGDESPHSKG